MKIIKSNYKSPFLNFALEELLLKEEKLNNENILLIYQNDNAIIVGKNQNTHEEINKDFVDKNKIIVARRISGGGAVYHDLGNVNFCFITNKGKDNSYAKFLEPIIGFLNTLGINAKFSGKNDVVANGYKISGNAQYKYKNRVFHHGTLLFDSKMQTLSKALNPSPLKFESKSIKSVRKRVSNIKKLMSKDISTNDFIDLLIKYFQQKGAILSQKSLINKSEINELAKIKSEYEWNFGKNPHFDFEVHKRFDAGTIKIKITAEKNIIKSIKFEGDFMSINDFEDIYHFFIDKPFNIKSIQKTIMNINDFSEYFGKITQQEILSLFINAQDNKK